MCDGCFWSQWADEDDLEFDEGGEQQANDRLKAYLVALAPERRAAIHDSFTDLAGPYEHGGGWIGGYFNGALHGAIDDDNYNDSYREGGGDWIPDPDRKGGGSFGPAPELSPDDVAVLDRWDALDEDERSIVVGFLAGYQMLANALA